MTAAALGLAVALAAGAAAGQDDTGDFRALPVISSHHGVLHATLTAEARAIQIDGVRLDALTFNGEYAGPVLRVRPGDRMKIHMVNHIDRPVNLHFHGYHGSPLGHGDNVHLTIAPGESLDYDMQIPADQPPGLYWYHTHIHGGSEEEINRGLSGAIIVDGLERRVPEAAKARPRLMVLKTFNVERPDDPAVKRLHGVVQSINGGVGAELHAGAGETELWRITNQSANDYVHLSVKGFHFRIVAIDGAATRQDLPADVLDVAPASRIEALVTMPAAGIYTLLSGSTPTGSGRELTLSRPLASIKVTGAAAADAAAKDDAGPAPAAAAAPPRQMPVDLRQAKISARRRFSFSQKPGEEVYMINGQTFDHSRIDTRVPLGSVEEWTLRNDTDDMHVFHIHQVHFQVVAINGAPQPFDRSLDTVRIPERGEVTIRIPFTNPRIVGRFVYHCHVLKHEDKGMMQNIEVYDPKAAHEQGRHGMKGHAMAAMSGM